MARPRTTLISRRRASEGALRIIDVEGLDALSIRRLGEELGVSGASLYHHFESKDQILVGAAQLALARVQAPVDDTEPWRTWLPRNARGLHDALVAHPHLIPVLLRREGLGIGLDQLERSVQLLEGQGVPSKLVLPLIDTLEIFAIASALQQVSRVDQARLIESDDGHPALLRAHRARCSLADDGWDIAASAIISAVERSLPLALR